MNSPIDETGATDLEMEDRTQAEKLLSGENRLLEMVAKGEPLPSILDGICRLVEEVSRGSLCSILLLDPNGNQLWHGAAPSLPDSYTRAFCGRSIGPKTGPCGRAAYYRRPVIVSDIAADPLGDGYRDLALAHGLHACWSTPILSSEGKALGSFAVLAREPRGPTPRHQKMIGEITHLAAVAIERNRTEAALQESEERFRRMAEAIPEVIWFTSLDPEKVLYVSPGFERIWGFPVGKLYQDPRLWTETIHPEDRERVSSGFSEWIAGGQVNYHNVEYRIVQPGGAIRWIHERGVLSLNGEGKPCLASGISTDITGRIRSEETLRASEKFARGQAEALTQTLDALAKESAPDRLVEHVLRTITGQLDAHSASVWRREGASGLAFEFAFEKGGMVTQADEVIAKLSPTLDLQDVWPWPEVFRTGKPRVLEDIREGPDFPWRARVLAQGVVTILIVPMLVAGRTEGVIGIRFRSKRAFREEEMQLAQALANQAMLAMQLTRLSAQSRQSAVMEERNRLARDIHDTLAQGFTGVIVQLEAAADANSQGLAKEAADHLIRAGNLARESLKEARRSVRALRPQALEEKDLCHALEGLIRKLTADTPVRAEFRLQGEPRKLPPEWEENLLRIGQEALTNALRHAQAGHFTAQLAFGRSEVRLELRDDGRGFDPADKNDGFGLLGMKERVEGMGGQIELQSKSGEGTAILIALPYPNDAVQSRMHTG